MSLIAAKTMLIQERMDWRRPHLRWLADRFYRNAKPFRK